VTLNGLLLVQLVGTLLMIGIIWFVQIVHYPLMGLVGVEGFAKYSQTHVARTQWVVGGPMLVEAFTCAGLLAWFPEHLASPPLAIADLLLLVIWVSTACLQIPLHEALTKGFDERRIRQLVQSNWLRTIAWTARGVLLGFALFPVLRKSCSLL